MIHQRCIGTHSFSNDTNGKHWLGLVNTWVGNIQSKDMWGTHVLLHLAMHSGQLSVGGLNLSIYASLPFCFAGIGFWLPSYYHHLKNIILFYVAFKTKMLWANFVFSKLVVLATWSDTQRAFFAHCAIPHYLRSISETMLSRVNCLSGINSRTCHEWKWTPSLQTRTQLCLILLFTPWSYSL